jgi:hypothetical protein
MEGRGMTPTTQATPAAATVGASNHENCGPSSQLIVPPTGENGTDEVYEASHIKQKPKQKRATKAEMQARKDALYEIGVEQQPMTVRQAFYQAVVRGLVGKEDYAKIQRCLHKMRIEGQLPWEWIVDHTRVRIKPTTWDSPAEVLRVMAAQYRRDLWAKTGIHVEIWCEKAALIGTLHPVTTEYDVSLMITKGQSSSTFLHEAGGYLEAMTRCGRKCFVYILTDHDGAGESICKTVMKGFCDYAPNADITVKRLALHRWQVDQYDLPTRPPNAKDRAKGWTECVDLDALPPNILRQLVRDAIENHIDHAALDALLRTEEIERKSFLAIADKLGGAA